MHKVKIFNLEKSKETELCSKSQLLKINKRKVA